MNLISKILYRTQKISQLTSAIFGVFLGFSLILTSSQIFTDFKNIIHDSEQAIGSQFLVINKKISLLNTFNIGNNSFNFAPDLLNNIIANGLQNKSKYKRISACLFRILHPSL